MSALVPFSNPLMLPANYNGQTYFTGQYFHQMYRANTDADGKYKQVSHFLRLIRSIEAYPIYVENGDIVELEWDRVKHDSSNPEIGLLLKSNSYKPIMLINATAQVALTHHLDDEVSKQASVTVNRHASRVTSHPTLPHQQAKAATAWLDATLKAAKLLGTDEPMARVVAVDVVREQVGVNWAPLLAANSVDDAPLTSTELGKLHGLAGGNVGAKMNLILADHEMAEKNEDGDWVPTGKGKPYATVNPYKSPNSNHTGYRTLWYRRVLDVIAKEEAA